MFTRQYSVTNDLQTNHIGLNLRGSCAPADILEPLYGGYVARPAAVVVLRILHAFTGRSDGTANIAIVGQEAVGGAASVAAAGAAGAVVVLLEAGLQLRHLGHGVRAAGRRNALRGKLQR